MRVPRPPSRCPEPSTVPMQTLGEALTQPVSELTERFPRQQITSIRLGGSDRFQPGSDIGSLNFLRGWEAGTGDPNPLALQGTEPQLHPDPWKGSSPSSPWPAWCVPGQCGTGQSWQG